LPILGTAQLANLTDQTVNLVTTDLESCQNNAYRLIKGEYPDYKKIIPEDLGGKVRVCINPKYLKKMAEAFADFDSVEIYIDKDPVKPVIFKQENYTGLIMPQKL
jgi:DNA polymerase III sliding clamp (beta) subunit (PCNA family)